MVSCAEPLIKRWEQLTASRSSEDGGRGEVQVEFSKQFQDLTADVISHTGFGSSYKEGKEVFHTQKQLLALAIATLLNVQLPGFKQVDLFLFLPLLGHHSPVIGLAFFCTSKRRFG
jgi:cytochrome P450 family 709